MTAYYNEIDPFAAAWLRELIAAGHIAPGEVDERSIEDVRSTDLVGYRQVHFFAGIGGWSLAARLAGWPDDRPLWTGSCPCQPFSVAGKQRGTDDERHLWPVMRDLIRERRPPVVAGEQVASSLGRGWLASVRHDLEALGYAVGAADLCAAGVGAPHIRHRLYWGAVRLGYAGNERCDRLDPLLRTDATGWDQATISKAARTGASSSVRLDDSDDARPQRRRERGHGGCEWSAGSASLDAWQHHGWVMCADGRARQIAPIARRMDDGISARVGLLRGYGNAIVPQVAETFLRALAG